MHLQVTVPFRRVVLGVWFILVGVMLHQNMFWIWFGTLSEVLSALDSKKVPLNSPYITDLIQIQPSDLAKPQNLGWENALPSYLHLSFLLIVLPFCWISISWQFHAFLPKSKRKPKKLCTDPASCPCHKFLVKLIIGTLRPYSPWPLSCGQNTL